MSEQQKVFASVSGALVAHIIFLIGIFVLLATRSESKDSSVGSRKPVPQPQEVTVMMSDFMETLEREKVKLEPQGGRKFVSTESNDREDEKPERPRFESDRNTTDASRLQPDEVLPQKDGPTLIGDGSDSDLTLEDQRYSDGDTDRMPSPSRGQGKGNGQSGGDSDALPSKGSRPQEKIYATQSDSTDAVLLRDEEVRDESLFNDPTKAKSGGGERGEDGFSAERRQDDRNGKTVKNAPNAVDAEKTAMGEYKQAVRNAVAKKWHLYRAEKEGTVIWGMLKLTFRVDKNGDVQKLQITKNEANATLLDISLRAIRESDLPAMPPEVANEVGKEGLEIRYDIITY